MADVPRTTAPREACTDRSNAIEIVYLINKTAQPPLNVFEKIVLFDIAENPGCSLRDICRRLEEPGQTINSAIMKKFKPRGFVVQDEAKKWWIRVPNS